MTDFRKPTRISQPSAICTFGQLPNAKPPTSQARGIVTDASDVHPQKAEYPIDVTDDGIAIDFSDVHRRKAKSPIDVTEDGIVTDVSPVQS